MTILAIDHGERKIGLAYSDETELVAAPLPTLRVKDTEQALQVIKLICEKQKVGRIVLGLPSGAYGVDSEQTTIVRAFKEELESFTQLPVEYWDETYSTKLAEHGARKRKRRNSDSEAARIILQEYLDRERVS